MESMIKIAIINQRYGQKVQGGSESYTRLLAEHLQSRFDITVLTTTALNYDTWKNEYPAGASRINGVKVLRFPVKRQRNMMAFRFLNKATFILKKAGIHTDRLWAAAQGPYTPALVRYIRNHADDYDIFLFVTYLYYPAVSGLPEAAGKSILIPTAHDEPSIHLPIYETMFRQAAAILYLTEEEKQFVQQKFHNEALPHDVIGAGIDIPGNLQTPDGRIRAVRRFRQDYQISGDYLIYAGRIDSGKNCTEMFTFFKKYRKEHPDRTWQLVVVGKAYMKIPKHPDIRYLGYVPEEDKYAAIAGAKWLWLPSRFESLSIALLEGMALGVPGLVNGACEVLKGHCLRSRGAMYYMGYAGFAQRLEEISGMEKKVYDAMSRRAEMYVKKNYRWELVEEKVCRLIDTVRTKDV